LKWAYGITTVPERQYNYLPKTIKSLKEAGFDKPTIFVDGVSGEFSIYELTVVYRSSKVLAFGNWLLSLLELWIRNPTADRFAIFQDDLITYKNLREYLDNCKLSDNTYWNLYTFPQNELLHSGPYGWFISNQRGRGALALVFSHSVVLKLLTDPRIMAKPRSKKNAHRSIDGVVVTTLSEHLKIREYVHYPTLVQHIGDCSSIGNRQHERPTSFLGEEYNALSLSSSSSENVHK
jgi:hypothetical protein